MNVYRVKHVCVDMGELAQYPGSWYPLRKPGHEAMGVGKQR